MRENQINQHSKKKFSLEERRNYYFAWKKSENELVPNSLKVKLVRVILSTGKTEVLATSLMDNSFSTEGPLYLY